MKKHNVIAFAGTLFLQVSALTYFANYSLTIQNDPAVKVVSLPCTAYDPYNPFKGRYVRLTITEDNPYINEPVEYYMQENFADKVDAMSSLKFSELKPELEIYVNEKGKYVQKGMTVMSEGRRIPIEEYLK